MGADYLSIATQLRDSKAVSIWKAEPEAQRNEHSSSITKTCDCMEFAVELEVCFLHFAILRKQMEMVVRIIKI